MNPSTRLRVAIQKSGRLSEKSFALLRACGLEFDWRQNKLLCACTNFPLDLMLVRDDDIAEFVTDGVCELGIVGQNMLEETLLERGERDKSGVRILEHLGFGGCRLSIALPENQSYETPQTLDGLKIATSYPATLQNFLDENNLSAEVLHLSGSVEIAPALQIADAICDLVSTGSTLRSNGLKEVQTILKSESVLIQTGHTFSAEKNDVINKLEQRLKGVLRAAKTKYIMMNAPLSALEDIKALIPGMEDPSVIPLGSSGERVAIHAVAREPDFWGTMEKLKEIGASSILVVPIEKIYA